MLIIALFIVSIAGVGGFISRTRVVDGTIWFWETLGLQDDADCSACRSGGHTLNDAGRCECCRARLW